MKKALAAVLLAAMALSLGGCASVFDKTYYSRSDYELTPESGSELPEGGAVEVSGYLELTLAINNLVAEHGESAVIHFTAYDGDIAEDLAAACREVSRDTALGAYAVDYISYDLDRIVAYYEAEVFVYYKRTAEELEQIVSVSTASGLYSAICDMLADMETELVAMVGASSVDEAAVLDYVDEAYFSDPLACVERPDATVSVYTGSGFQRIVELRLNYHATASAMQSRRSVIENRLNSLLGYVTSDSQSYRALQCAIALVNECSRSESAPGTLWSALMAGEANSEGIAVAYKALCDAAGVECVVVEGRFERDEHFWNIITVDGASYHADISRAMELGFTGTFLTSDAQMWGSYWWDDQDYPECAGPLSYSALVSGGMESEAPASDSPGPESEPTPSQSAEPA